jgi:hypothetical protein
MASVDPLSLQHILLQNIEKLSTLNHNSFYSKVLKLIVANNFKENDAEINQGITTNAASLGQYPKRYTQEINFEKESYKLFSSLKNFNYSITDKFEKEKKNKTFEYNTLELIPDLLKRIGNYKISLAREFDGGIYKVNFFKVYKDNKFLTREEVAEEFKNPLNTVYFENVSIKKLARNFEETSRNLEGELSFKFGKFELITREYKYEHFLGPISSRFEKEATEPKFTLKDLVYPKTSISANPVPTEIYNENDMKFFLIIEFLVPDSEEASKTYARSYDHPFYDLVRNPIILECVVYRHEFEIPPYFKDREIKSDSFYYTLKTSFTAFVEAASKNPSYGSVYDIFAAFDDEYADVIEENKEKILGIENQYINKCRESRENAKKLEEAKKEYLNDIKTPKEALEKILNDRSRFEYRFDNFLSIFTNICAEKLESINNKNINALDYNNTRIIADQLIPNLLGYNPGVDFIVDIGQEYIPDGTIIKVGSTVDNYLSISYVFFGDLLEILFPDDSINTCGDIKLIITESGAEREILVNIADIPVSVALIKQLKKEFIDDRIPKKEQGFSSMAFMDNLINKLKASTVQTYGSTFLGINNFEILNNTVINPINIINEINTENVGNAKLYKPYIEQKTFRPEYNVKILKTNQTFVKNRVSLSKKNIKVLKKEQINSFLKDLSDKAFDVTKRKEDPNAKKGERTYNHIWYSPTKRFLSKDFLLEYSNSENIGVTDRQKTNDESNVAYTVLNVQVDPTSRSQYFNWLRKEYGMHGFSIDPIFGGYAPIKDKDGKIVYDDNGRIKQSEMQPSIKNISLERMDIEHLREAQITSDTYRGFIRLPYKANIEFYAPFFNIFENGDYVYLLPPVLFKYSDEQLSTLKYSEIKETFIKNFNTIGIGGVYLITEVNLSLKFLPKLTSDDSYTIDIQNSSCNVVATFSSYGDGTPTLGEASAPSDNCIQFPSEGQ